jgi:hypothetical protein
LPECSLRDVEAVTWCSSEDEDRLLTAAEMGEAIDDELGLLMAIRKIRRQLVHHGQPSSVAWGAPWTSATSSRRSKPPIVAAPIAWTLPSTTARSAAR